jgi:hypothetical protein
MILTADEICKAVGARAASERWLKDAQAIESALLEKLRCGVELPEPDAADGFSNWFREPKVLQYGAAQWLAGRERGTCTWTEQDDKDMPSTYESSCGEMWSFTDGGIKENRVTYCHHCGGKVVLAASPQEQT